MLLTTQVIRSQRYFEKKNLCTIENEANSLLRLTSMTVVNFNVLYF